MQSLNRSILSYAYDILAAQTAFVHPRRRHPFVAILIMNGNVSSRRGGHVSPVNALHGRHNLVSGMKTGEIHSR
jgi:hypothetical protein